MKPGYKTTEFWLALSTNVLGVIATQLQAIESPWAIVALAIVNAGYAVSRGLTKKPE